MFQVEAKEVGFYTPDPSQEQVYLWARRGGPLTVKDTAVSLWQPIYPALTAWVCQP